MFLFYFTLVVAVLMIGISILSMICLDNIIRHKPRSPTEKTDWRVNLLIVMTYLNAILLSITIVLQVYLFYKKMVHVKIRGKLRGGLGEKYSFENFFILNGSLQILILGALLYPIVSGFIKTFQIMGMTLPSSTTQDPSRSSGILFQGLAYGILFALVSVVSTSLSVMAGIIEGPTTDKSHHGPAAADEPRQLSVRPLS